jgi:nucleotide-binding universal stress UspA family protein
MRILHPTDFSRPAEAARRIAVDLKTRLNASLHVVHVQARFMEGGHPYVAAQMEHISPELQKRLAEERATETEQLRERLATLAEDGATSELVWGEPLRELLRLSAEYDLVVMGAHGDDPFDQVFLGGIAGRVVRRTATPIVTVRGTATVTHVRTLLVATDFSEAALAAWSYAVKIAGRGGLKLVLAHVIEARGAIDTTSANDRLEALSAGRAERLAIRQGHPAEVLPQIADDVGADVIVVGLTRHAFIPGLILGSRADALVRSSPVPILNVPVS